MGEVTIDTARGPVPGVLAVPGSEPPWPGVVVIHDALGMTTDLRRQTEWLADNGFLALAPDLLHRGPRLRCVVRAMRDVSRRRGRSFEDVEAARAWLVGRPDCSGRVGVLGFCLGGGFAVLLAAGGRYDAASVNYGPVPEDADSLLAGSCPLVGSYGGRDSSLRSDPARLEHALGANDVPHEVTTYPDAGHSFLNDHPRAEMPVWAVVAGRLAGTGYHEPSALEARARIIAFLTAHLTPAADAG